MKFVINQVKKDEFGRISGILGINKPIGITSHDVVDKVRRSFQMRKVGHAGTLDPFASGMLVILLGKATKLSDSLMQSDKEYVANILFGIQTNSADPEGEILAINPSPDITGLENTLTQFVPTYDQYVPVFSSVKIDGNKLRVLARKADKFEVITEDNSKYALFYQEDKVKKVELPKHTCRINKLELLTETTTDISNTTFYQQNTSQIGEATVFPTAEIVVACSKGTYIRTMAEDVGANLPTPSPAMLLELQRSRVGEFYLKDAVEIDQLEQIAAKL